MIIPNYVGQLQTGAPFILAALGVVVFLLLWEWLGEPKDRGPWRK